MSDTKMVIYNDSPLYITNWMALRLAANAADSMEGKEAREKLDRKSTRLNSSH